MAPRAADNRTITRRVGYSKAGAAAKTNLFFFHKGRRFSILGPFVLDEGFLEVEVVEGGFNAESYRQAVNKVVVSARRDFRILARPPPPCRLRALSTLVPLLSLSRVCWLPHSFHT